MGVGVGVVEGEKRREVNKTERESQRRVVWAPGQASRPLQAPASTPGLTEEIFLRDSRRCGIFC